MISAIISLASAILGCVAVVAYKKYRDHKRDQESFRLAEEVLDRARLQMAVLLREIVEAPEPEPPEPPIKLKCIKKACNNEAAENSNYCAGCYPIKNKKENRKLELY
jgi:hypothetical protein